jgi:Domain of unknown function (DUF4062)
MPPSPLSWEMLSPASSEVKVVGQRKYQIFVSSTFQDLTLERRAVTEVILSMGHIPVGMELFEAGNEDQWSYIKNRINEVDYYIVIVAERYGSVGPDGVSYTEMEYRYAVQNEVPVAALLLDQAQRSLWPRGKIDFENQGKLEEFRQLCEKRMVSYWSDSGSLTTKCQLALNGLFRRYPRTGWVSADQAVSPHLASELARLSAENAKLRDELLKYADAEGARKEIERVTTILHQPIVSEIRRLSAKFGGKYTEMLDDRTIANILNRCNMFDLIVNKAEILIDGDNELTICSHIRDYLEEIEKSSSESGGRADLRDTFRFLIRVMLLNWRVHGLIEVYEGQDERQKVVKKIKMSSLARRGFELALSRFLDSQ